MTTVTELDPAILQLRDTFASALESFDRENALSTDKHPPDCMCAPCQLVSASRELVQFIDGLKADARR